MKPGIYPASVIPMSKYIADPCEEPSLSSGTVHRLMAESPLHAWRKHPKLGMKEKELLEADDHPVNIGSVAHDLLLGGEGKICEIDPADYPAKTTGNIPVGWSNNAIRAARDKAIVSGLTPILSSQMGSVRNMVAAAKAFIDTSEIAELWHRPSESESTLIWQEHNGVWCRARPDRLALDYSLMLHYKTSAGSVNPRDWPRRVFKPMGYDTSIVWYARGLASLVDHSKLRHTRHVVLAQEQEPPYACALFGLDSQSEFIANARIERGIALWRRCLDSANFPGYGSTIHGIEPTPWELARHESDEWEMSAKIRDEEQSQ